MAAGELKNSEEAEISLKIPLVAGGRIAICGNPMKSSLGFLKQNVLPSAVGFLLVLALAYAGLFERVENLTLDLRTRERIKYQPEADPRLAVVAIDDESIEKIGRWPWSRARHGEFIELATSAKAAVVTWDILFSEPDTDTPANDLRLAQGSARARAAGTAVIIGAVTNLTEGAKSEKSVTQAVTNIEGDISRIPGDVALLPPIPVLQEQARLALVNTPPGTDGYRRIVPLLGRAGTRVYFSLSIESVLQFWKVPPTDVEVRLGDGIYFTAGGVKRRVPIDETGGYLVNYRFGIEGANAFGFSLLTEGLREVFIQRKKVDDFPDLSGKILLVGQVATALTDMGPTPISGFTPLVLVHANVIENLLREDYVTSPSPIWVWLTCTMIGIVGLAVFSNRGLLAQATFAICVPLIYAPIGYYAWVRFSFWLPLVWPVVGFAGLQIFMISRRLLAEQRAKAQIKGMFGTYVSPALVNRMVESGESPQLGGHEDEITAYFSDIQGFSTFSEKLPPDRLVELMNEYLTACTDIVQEEGGTLDKYIGDAVVAMFGAPIGLPDHAFRACVATQRVQKKLLELRVKWQSEGDKWPAIVWRMQSRIGLNSGNCIIGNMGSRTRFNYTMMGDNVNLAARMESQAKSWGVYTMCADATKLACEQHGGDRVVFRPLGQIVVMGRSRPVPFHEIVGLKEDVTPETLECLRLFAEGLARYYARDWDGAVALFERSQLLEPNIPGKTPGVSSNPSLVFADLARAYREHPPAEGWDGVHVAKSK